MSAKPWTSGPQELIVHAIDHLRGGKPFDCRIAMISIDNAVELAIKTYLGLPKRVRGTDGPGRKELEDGSMRFPDLLEKNTLQTSLLASILATLRGTTASETPYNMMVME